MTFRHNHKHAFTLVEVLLAMTITSIIILGIHGAYRQGRMMWDRSESDAQVYHQINTLAEMLRTEIGSIYIPSNAKTQQDNSNKEGEKKKEKDFFVLSSSGLSFYTLNPSDSTSPRYAKISKVSYTCKSNKMTRTELLAAGAKTIEVPSGDDSKASIAASFDIQNVRFEACVIDEESKKYVWKDNFKSKDSIPKAIAINFQKPATKYSPGFESKLIVKCIQ